MSTKRLHLISTSGDRSKAQPMIDSVKLCADFLAMPFAGALWGKGGLPDAVHGDAGCHWWPDSFCCLRQRSHERHLIAFDHLLCRRS